MKRSFLYISLLSLFFTALDAGGKYFALTRLSETTKETFFQFALYKNPGIAFSIPLPLPVVIPLSIAAIIFLTWYAIKNRQTKPISSGFAVMATLGAANNAIDRAIHNFTTDYLIFFERSAINISDILIIVGIFVLVFYTENKERR